MDNGLRARNRWGGGEPLRQVTLGVKGETEGSGARASPSDRSEITVNVARALATCQTLRSDLYRDRRVSASQPACKAGAGTVPVS